MTISETREMCVQFAEKAIKDLEQVKTNAGLTTSEHKALLKLITKISIRCDGLKSGSIAVKPQ